MSEPIEARNLIELATRDGVVVHVPHASIDIPAETLDQFVISPSGLETELRLMTDRYTDALFQLPQEIATTIRFPVSRLVVDPERFEQDEHEPMAARGMGVIYERTAGQSALRRPLQPRERERLLDLWYRPHHAALTAAVEAALARHGSCLVIDSHSFPSCALPYELNQDADRPDICIGTDVFHTPAELEQAAVSLTQALGWSVTVNAPFAGALVPLRHYRRDARVQAIMIEVNRRLYMDEASGLPNAGFGACRKTLLQLLAGVMAANPRRQ